MITVTGIVTDVSSFTRKSGQTVPFVELDGVLQIDLPPSYPAPSIGQNATIPTIASKSNGYTRFKAMPGQTQPAR